MHKKLFPFFLRSLASTALDIGVTMSIIALVLREGVYGAFAGICVAGMFSLLRQFVALPEQDDQEAEPGIA